MRRIKPRTVSELMDIANRFADGEDACNNKRTRDGAVMMVPENLLAFVDEVKMTG
jgi:hypothetical protein